MGGAGRCNGVFGMRDLTFRLERAGTTDSP